MSTPKVVLSNLTVPYKVEFSCLMAPENDFYGAKRIYDGESKWRHAIGSEQLLSGMAVIKSFFSNFDHHLSFLRTLPSISAYVNSNFTSSNDKAAVQSIFYDLVKATREIYQIAIVDAAGNERIGVINTRSGGHEHEFGFSGRQCVAAEDGQDCLAGE